MKPLREIIIERLIQNKKLEQPDADTMNDYVTELMQSQDYDLLDEFEQMILGNK